MSDVFNQFVQFGYEFEKLFASTFNHVYSSILGTTPDNRVMSTKGGKYPVLNEERRTLFLHQCGPAYFVKLAGLSGAMAVAFAAYGAHFGILFFYIHCLNKANCI